MVALARVENGIERAEPPALEFTNQQIEMIRHSLGMDKATPLEFDLFLNLCKAKRLDPLTKQMYAVNIKGKWQFFASIDGLRVIAQRTGEYGGQTAPLWCGEDLEWREAWLDEEKPAAAKVGVYKRGYPHPTWGVATFKSYGTGKQNNWLSMPDVMLAKCAEAIALRKAFPDDLSALYVREEFENIPDRQIESVAVMPDEHRLAPEEYEAIDAAVRSVRGIVETEDVIDAETGRIDTPESLRDEIKHLREALGWSAQDVVDEAAKQQPPIPIKTVLGMMQMRDLLEEYVEGA